MLLLTSMDFVWLCFHCCLSQGILILFYFYQRASFYYIYDNCVETEISGSFQFKNLRLSSSITKCVCYLLSNVQLCNPMDSSLPGFSVHGISQAILLQWVTIPFSIKVFLNFLFDFIVESLVF